MSQLINNIIFGLFISLPVIAFFFAIISIPIMTLNYDKRHYNKMSLYSWGIFKIYIFCRTFAYAWFISVPFYQKKKAYKETFGDYNFRKHATNLEFILSVITMYTAYSWIFLTGVVLLLFHFGLLAAPWDKILSIWQSFYYSGFGHDFLW